jgi:hypothetical protein
MKERVNRRRGREEAVERENEKEEEYKWKKIKETLGRKELKGKRKNKSRRGRGREEAVEKENGMEEE